MREPETAPPRPVVNVRAAAPEAELGPLLGAERLDATVCFPEGPRGAHELLNHGQSAVRGLLLSTTGLPANVCYPDSGRWLIRNGAGRDELVGL